MLRIALCDDETKDLEIIRTLTIELLRSLNIEFEIEEFTNGYELLESKISFDLLLLDIEMDEINGIEIAQNIRTYNKDAKIIFITNSQNYLRIGYTVKAEGYFIKPIDKIEFNHELSNVLRDKILDNKFILDKRIGPYKIYLNQILYIEFFDRKTIIHREDEVIATFITLKEWISLLGNYNFSQCHKAYIINLQYVNKLNVDSLILSNGDRIPLSRKYKNNFKSQYYAYIAESV